MSNSQRHLELPASWRHISIAGEPGRTGAAHLFATHYYTAFCGFNAQQAAEGIAFRLEPAEIDAHRCETCRRVAAQSRFNQADATI